jgi:quinol-cytochrome oxidoreductase complex cytochrome b subunit
VLVFVLAFHFWRVRKAGGVVGPPAAPGEPAEDAKVLFLPHQFVRELMLALVVTAVVVVLAAAFGAPLGDRANPGMSPNPAKAPWYFMGIQELLVHFHPTVAVLVIPGLALAALALLPYLTADDEPAGEWFLSARARAAAGVAAGTGVVCTVAAVLAHEALAPRLPALAGAWSVVVGGVLPLVAVLGVVALFRRRIQRVYGLSRNETTHAVVVLLFAAFVVLTVIGVWFRGEGMALAWPWQGGP